MATPLSEWVRPVAGRTISGQYSVEFNSSAASEAEIYVGEAVKVWSMRLLAIRSFDTSHPVGR
jgi:hypothetical protein